MENSSAGQSMCIGGDGAGVAGLGPPFSLSLSLFLRRVCVCTAGGEDEGKKKKKPASAELVLVHPLRAEANKRKERPGD